MEAQVPTLVVLLWLLNYPALNCEVFTAISHLKALVDVEQKLTGYLSTYVEKEESRLKRIVSFYDPSEQLFNFNSTSEDDVEEYVGNPINGYRMLRRLAHFDAVENLIQTDFTKGINSYSVNPSSSLPHFIFFRL